MSKTGQDSRAFILYINQSQFESHHLTTQIERIYQLSKALTIHLISRAVFNLKYTQQIFKDF